MKVFALTQIRFSSNRLPGKILKKFGGKTFLDVFLQRLKQIKNIDGVICAVANEKNNKKILDIVKKNKCLIFIGSKDNVFERIYKAGKKFNADIILRVTSDCPLVDPKICESAINKLKIGNYDYVSNNLEPSFPHGLDCEAFRFKILNQSKKILESTNDQSIKEHVTSHIKKNKNIKKYNIKSNLKLNRYERWTLDNKIDLKFFKELSKYINDKDLIKIQWKDILKIINKNKNLQKINNTTHHFWFE